jgi:hypothetical protein
MEKEANRRSFEVDRKRIQASPNVRRREVGGTQESEKRSVSNPHTGTGKAEKQKEEKQEEEAHLVFIGL